MKILVTGGSGFIGSHIVRYFDGVSYDKVNGQDVLDTNKLKEAVEKCDVVFHLAGLLGTHELVDDVPRAVMTNILGSVNVLEACKATGKKLFLASKPNVWNNTYSITKDCVEQFVKMYREEHGVKAVVVKWFNVYGPGQPLEEEIGYKKAVPTWIMSMLKGDPLEVYGDGTQTMDLIHTEDICSSAEAILNNWEVCEGETFEIGKDEVSCNELAEMIGGEVKYLPMRKGEVEHTQLKANTSLIMMLTGWKARKSLEEGLSETIEWYREKWKLAS